MRSEKHLLPLPLLLAICCLGTLHLSSGFPQSVPSYLEGLDIPESERHAFCFSQWTALQDQEQIPSFVMDLCSSIYNRMKVNEFSRAKDPSLKIGESQIATAEYTKRDSSGIVGRPFFLFRPRNGRKVSINEH
uniref:Isoform 6 of Neuromedin-S n=1 Tax=Bombina maxima TaxID=161274 RepID=Q4QXT8-6|nr:nms-17 protein [Bombina maxima]